MGLAVDVREERDSDERKLHFGGVFRKE